MIGRFLLAAFFGKVVGFSAVEAEFFTDAALSFFLGERTTLDSLGGTREVDVRGFLHCGGSDVGSLARAKGGASV